ncbi:MAG: O-antigen ligase family protein [Anaerolineae bacterium]
MTSAERTSPSQPPNRWRLRVAHAAAFYDRYEWLLVLALAPFLLLPSMERAGLVLVLPVLWVVVGLARRRLLPGTPLDWPLALMAFMVLVSAAVTYDLSLSLPKIAGMVLGVAIFRVVAQSRRAPLLPLALLLAIGCGVAGMGLLVTQWVNKVPILAPVLSRLPRSLTSPLPGTETGVNPNEVAGALLWVVPVVTCVLVGCLRARRRLDAAVGRRLAAALVVALTAAALLTGGVLLLTQSRSAYLALAATGSLALLLLFPRRWRPALVACIALAAVVGAALLLTGVASPVLAGFSGGQGDGGAAALSSLEQRAEVWSRAIYGLQDFPFTGMGMNTFRRIVHVLYPLFLIGPDVDIAHAHNEFLQAGLDLGLPGLVAFVSLYMGAFWMLARSARAAARSDEASTEPASLASLLDEPPLARLVPIGLAAGLFAHMLYGLTDAIALGAKPGAVFWLMLALSARVYLCRCRPASGDQLVHSTSACLAESPSVESAGD